MPPAWCTLRVDAATRPCRRKEDAKNDITPQRRPVKRELMPKKQIPAYHSIDAARKKMPRMTSNLNIGPWSVSWPQQRRAARSTRTVASHRRKRWCPSWPPSSYDEEASANRGTMGAWTNNSARTCRMRTRPWRAPREARAWRWGETNCLETKMATDVLYVYI